MRVLVTRPADDARRTTARLAALGHAAVVAPATTIIATGEPPPVSVFDAVAVTSAHAVPALAAIRARIGERPVFAVGTRTAEAVAAAGFGRVIAGDRDATALAARMVAGLPANSAVLHVAGRHRRVEPERSLSAAGFAVAVWSAYEAVAVPAWPEEVCSAFDAGLDAALHYSARSAVLSTELARRAERFSVWRDLVHVCLSADVAGPLERLGCPRLIVAARPDEASLLAALARFDRRAVSP